jgi:hypothetical protein
MKTRMGDEGDAIECPTADVPPDLGWVWRAWWRLSDGRAWLGGGMGPPIPAPIAWRAVVEWAEYYGYDAAMVQDLDACVRALDSVYIRHVIDKAK